MKKQSYEHNECLFYLKTTDDFEQGFQYALHVLNELGVDIESLLGSDVFKNKEPTYQ